VLGVFCVLGVFGGGGGIQTGSVLIEQMQIAGA